MDRSSTKLCQPLKPRSSERLNVPLEARLTLSCGTVRPVTISNLSPEGVRFDAEAFVPIGSEALLELPAGVQATTSIRWQVGCSAGAKFTPSLSWDQIQRIVTEATQSPSRNAAPNN
jgi:hypothetical protein